MSRKKVVVEPKKDFVVLKVTRDDQLEVVCGVPDTLDGAVESAKIYHADGQSLHVAYVVAELKAIVGEPWRGDYFYLPVVK